MGIHTADRGRGMIFGRYTVREAFFERFMINQQKLVAYATDTATNEILYMTQAAATMYRFEDVRDTYGKKCYELIQGLDDVCPFCTNSKLKPGRPYQWEHYNRKLQMWFDITDILVMFEGKNCRLEIARMSQPRKKNSTAFPTVLPWRKPWWSAFRHFPVKRTLMRQ